MTTLIIQPNECTIKTTNYEAQESVLSEAMLICDDALKKGQNHKRIYGLLSALFFMLLCITVATDAPYGFNILYHVLRVLITVILIFTIIMATLWNKIERNAVLAGRLAMEVSLKRTLKK